MRQVLTNLSKTVASAGTAEALSATNIYTSYVVVQAKSDNTGRIYVGGSNVSSALCAADLSAGSSVSFGVSTADHGTGSINLAEIYIDAGTNDDGVNIGYLKATPGHS